MSDVDAEAPKSTTHSWTVVIVIASHRAIERWQVGVLRNNDEVCKSEEVLHRSRFPGLRDMSHRPDELAITGRLVYPDGRR